MLVFAAFFEFSRSLCAIQFQTSDPLYGTHLGGQNTTNIHQQLCLILIYIKEKQVLLLIPGTVKEN